MKIRDLMTTDVVTVTPETTLKEVARRLLENHVSGAPVVDAEGRVLGVVSETDILHKECDHEADDNGLMSRLLHRGNGDLETKVEARTAGEAMTAPPLTVDQNFSVAYAAALMLEHEVTRLIVTAPEGTLRGIVARDDLIRAFARSDHELAGEIDRILRDELWIVPGTVDVAIREGEVTIKGVTDTDETAEAITAALRRVPGIVSMTSHLTARTTQAQSRT